MRITSVWQASLEIFLRDDLPRVPVASCACALRIPEGLSRLTGGISNHVREGDQWFRALEDDVRGQARSADHGHIDMADGNRLTGLDGWTGGVDVGGGIGGRGVAGRHAYQKHCNRSNNRNAQDFGVGVSVGGKNR